jgi:uncharacterized protein (DUF2267 family)
MTPKHVEAFDMTVQMTNVWLREIGDALGIDQPRHAYLALRGTLHALRDVLPLDESAQLAAQLPMLVRGLYYEGWDPSAASAPRRTPEHFLWQVERELAPAMRGEANPIAAEDAARAVLGVLAAHVSAGEVDQARQTLPEPLRQLWPVDAGVDRS